MRGDRVRRKDERGNDERGKDERGKDEGKRLRESMRYRS
jgi:hypothetical protein